jgi:hypothetical protein
MAFITPALAASASGCPDHAIAAILGVFIGILIIALPIVYLMYIWSR